MKNFRFNSVKKCYGLQLHYSFSSSVVKSLFLESWVLNQLIPSIGFVLSWPQTVVPWWNSVSPQLSLPVWLCNFWLVQKLLKLAIHQKNGKTSKIMSQEKWLIKYLVLYSLVPRNFSVWLWLLVKLLSMYWLVCTVIQLKWELVSVVWSLSNFLLLDSLFCFLTNFFQRYDSFRMTHSIILSIHTVVQVIKIISGLWSWIWYFTFHRHQYLWNHRLESILPNHRQCWSWCWIRRSHRCPFPPFGHQEW